MSQHSYTVSNQTGALVRADFNNALLAIVSNNSGASEPADTFPYMFWLDTANNLLKCRNAGDSAWVIIGTPSLDGLGLLTLDGGTMTGALLAAVGSLGNCGIGFDGDLDSGFYWVSANTWGLVANATEYLRISPAGITFLGTGSTQLPSGTTAQRPGSPVNGMVRYNSDLTVIEGYVNGAWKIIATADSYPFTTSDFNDVIPMGTASLVKSDFGGINSNSQIVPMFAWSAPVKLSNPASLPPNDGEDCRFSPSGEFLAIAHLNSPYISVYQRSGAEFVKLASPSALPGSANTVSWSRNGNLLAVTHSSSPFMTVYTRAGSVFTKLTDPATLPASTANGVAVSNNSEFVACAHNSSPFVSIYRRSGTTLTKLTDPTDIPIGNARCAAWSPDDRFLAIGHQSGSPFIIIYEITAGATFTKLANPSSLPPSTTTGIAFSPDGIYMAVAHFSSPYITVYLRSGTTFTKITNPSSLPTGTANSCVFSPDSRYLAVSHDSSPYLTIYEIVAGVLTKISDPASLPAGDGNGVDWSSDGQFVSFSHTTTPYLTFYQTSADMPAESILTIKKKSRGGT